MHIQDHSEHPCCAFSDTDHASAFANCTSLSSFCRHGHACSRLLLPCLRIRTNVPVFCVLFPVRGRLCQWLRRALAACAHLSQSSRAARLPLLSEQMRESWSVFAELHLFQKMTHTRRVLRRTSRQTDPLCPGAKHRERRGEAPVGAGCAGDWVCARQLPRGSGACEACARGQPRAWSCPSSAPRECAGRQFAKQLGGGWEAGAHGRPLGAAERPSGRGAAGRARGAREPRARRVSRQPR